ncbi:response regulator containing a CheY-like receiver domain and an HTH DNA-binding domain [Terriglobus roseus DSM 18391]|uniref:Response regulator containing a CheY-like receiver domain and an HTH DNA-binding domain n=1 Tax=Terriglobus roseus (strain DSM 18391 / NRRL B-41598 / KBS 63) TaxID=926566 RepID=I3ZE14_TERRK|nr:response regulator transcription factor [Terriglobus roseus]AFL87482.1 response regulator containing a CheY-like receiver domain and an HTH DNA-binding domain [Terriglobus roseus DSM 18391]
MRLVVADDHALMRRGIRDLISGYQDCTILAEASQGDEAVNHINALQPDVAILDLSMPVMTGPEVARAVATTAPSTRIIILTMHDSEGTLRQIVECGAHGYVLKGEADIYLGQALRSVMDGQLYFHTAALEMMRKGYLRPAQIPTADPLTQREREILTLLAKGLSSKEAAVTLDISTRTVETHRLNIYRKLRIATIADLVRYAIRENYVTAA